MVGADLRVLVVLFCWVVHWLLCAITLCNIMCWVPALHRHIRICSPLCTWSHGCKGLPDKIYLNQYPLYETVIAAGS